ncbi:MAG: hypothetical protein HY821_01570, partial [Acidobacteria bacterium]|nr:hypothetical protein [Acidobacteriota bacterium]
MDDRCSGGNCGLYLWGRLSRIVYGNGMVETHSYTTAGLLAWKNFLPAANLAIGLKTEYSWDNEGRMTQMKYPMTGTASGQGWYNEVPGSVLAYSYDSAGRMTGMTRDGSSVVSNATWNAAGQPLTMGAYSFAYNSRGQMTSESGPGSTVSYTYSATANDGRVQSRQRTSGGPTETVEYLYDELGRLISAATTGPEWGLTWSYDGFGNRLAQNVTKGSLIGPVISVNPATNRISTGGFSYDANGNMTQWPLGGNTITGNYDVENRLASVDTTVYRYNAANQRVVVGDVYYDSDPRYSVYGLNGELLGEYRKCSGHGGSYYPCNRSERVYFAGRWMGTMVDRLGTVGVTSYPYGEGNPEFATYRKDDLTGLHYAWNRYYSATWGRFATVDPYQHGASPTNPQSWNAFAYVNGD